MLDIEWSYPVVFHFRVRIAGLEASFQEVSGLEYSLETEEVRAGGDNSTVYNLPQKIKYQDLVLKRAVLKLDDPFAIWYKANAIIGGISAFKVIPIPVEVELCDEHGLPIKMWIFRGAYPCKWGLCNLDAMKNELAIESITFKYSNFLCIK